MILFSPTNLILVAIGLASVYLIVNVTLRLIDRRKARHTVYQAPELAPLVAWSLLPQHSALGIWHLELEKADFSAGARRISRAA